MISSESTMVYKGYFFKIHCYIYSVFLNLVENNGNRQNTILEQCYKMFVMKVMLYFIIEPNFSKKHFQGYKSIFVSNC